MDKAKTHTQIKHRWWMYILPSLPILLGDLLARLWGLPLIASYILVTILVIFPLYWLIPSPRKFSFMKYAGSILVFIGLFMGILWGIPMLLKHYIPFVWAFSLTWVAFWQSLYWFAYWKKPAIFSLRVFAFWLLLSLLPAIYPIWMQYQLQSILKAGPPITYSFTKEIEVNK